MISQVNFEITMYINFFEERFAFQPIFSKKFPLTFQNKTSALVWSKSKFIEWLDMMLPQVVA